MEKADGAYSLSAFRSSKVWRPPPLAALTSAVGDCGSAKSREAREGHTRVTGLRQLLAAPPLNPSLNEKPRCRKGNGAFKAL